MMSTGLEKVDLVDDMADACDIIKSFGLSTKGLTTLDEMKNKLREHLRGLEGTSSRMIGEVCNQSDNFIFQRSQIFKQNVVKYPNISKSKLSDYMSFRLIYLF